MLFGCHFFSKMNFYLPLGKWVVIHTERGQLLIILKWLPSHTRCERYTKLLACPKFPPSKFGLGCEPQSILRSFKVALGEAAFFSILFCAFCIKLWKIYFVQLLNYTLLAPISLFLFFKTFFIHLFHVCILPIPKCMLRHKFTAAFTPIFFIYMPSSLVFDIFPCSDSQYLGVPILQIIQVYIVRMPLVGLQKATQTRSGSKSNLLAHNFWKVWLQKRIDTAISPYFLLTLKSAFYGVGFMLNWL